MYAYYVVERLWWVSETFAGTLMLCRTDGSEVEAGMAAAG